MPARRSWAPAARCPRTPRTLHATRERTQRASRACAIPPPAAAPRPMVRAAATRRRTASTIAAGATEPVVASVGSTRARWLRKGRTASRGTALSLEASASRGPGAAGSMRIVGQDEFCRRSTFTCQAKLANGAELPQDALHESCAEGDVNAACASGRCNAAAGTCAGPNGSASCTEASQFVNRCGADGNCGGASGQDACTTATQAADCQSGHCSATAGRCVDGAAGCWVDADCSDSSTVTVQATSAKRSCSPGRRCRPMACMPSCSSGANSACPGGQCNATAVSCSGPNGATACTLAAQCSSNVCGSDGHCGGVNGEQDCSDATASAACQSGLCSASGKCVPSESGCWVDADCAGDKFCHRASFSCMDKLTRRSGAPGRRSAPELFGRPDQRRLRVRPVQRRDVHVCGHGWAELLGRRAVRARALRRGWAVRPDARRALCC